MKGLTSEREQGAKREELSNLHRAHNSFGMYYVYLLKNRAQGVTYVGYTDDLERRIREHRSKNPELVYYEAYKAERDARVRELALKRRGQTVRRLKERLRWSLG